MGLNSPSDSSVANEAEPRDNKDSKDSTTTEVISSKNETSPLDSLFTLKDGLVLAKSWGANFYKKVVSSGETTARAIAERVKIEDVGANVQDILKQELSRLGSVPLIREFQKSQAEFEAAHSSDAGDAPSPMLPWHPDVSGLTDERMVEKLRTRILSLSKQPNTFLLAPPVEAQMAETLSSDDVQLAKALLREDPNLDSMRYSLVPKKISEDLFWRNYFYRVSVVRQSFQLSAMSGSAIDEAPDFVCIEDNSIWTEATPEETNSPSTTSKPSSELEKPAKNTSKKDKPKKSKHRKSDLAATNQDAKSTNPSDLTEEQLLEAELAREVDELVLISSKSGEPDELDRELEMELLAELDREESS